MAKGQIHMGKNGPEKCGVDTSNPRSRGCPYESTGHYSSADEAMESYAKLNRVEPSELRELVADGASPKDAVGLIRSGYGRDYLVAAKRDPERVPLVTLENESANYLEAKTQVALRLEELAPGTTVEGTRSAQGRFGLLVRNEAEHSADRFSFIIQEDGTGELTFEALSENEPTEEAKAVGAELKSAIHGDGNPGLRTELQTMILSYERMTAEEPTEES